jgi:hypothetical protein
VRQAVDDGRCSDVPGQLRQIDDGIDDLPPSTDQQLVTRLRDGAQVLRDVARDECDATPTQTTTTETATTETQTTETTDTGTLPTETEPQTTPTPTPTIPPETTPQAPPPPPEPVPPPEPAPAPPPPSGTPGGGVEPDLP